MLARIRELSENYGLRVANVFHAGDGNLHPLILYDANKPGELERAEAFGADILQLCVAVGGVLTGEHGVGVEKRDLMGEMFNEIDLAQQQRVKCAFDDRALLNPGKVFPLLHRCAELGRVHVHARQGRLPRPAAVLMLARPPSSRATTAEVVRRRRRGRRRRRRRSRWSAAAPSAAIGRAAQTDLYARRIRARPASSTTSRRSWC